jgi:hypothetical protein
MFVKKPAWRNLSSYLPQRLLKKLPEQTTTKGENLRLHASFLSP